MVQDIDLELIIVDDGSSDQSIDVIRSFSDTRIRLLTQNNSGAHAAINRGLATANAKYLTILNSDDVYHPTRLSDLTEHLRREGKQIATSWLEIIDSNGLTIGTKEAWQTLPPWDLGESKNLTNPDIQLALSNFVCTTSNIVFSKMLFEKIGGMRPFRFVHDWDFLLRACSSYDIAIITKPLVKYRVHDSNTISSDRKWMLFEICLVQAANLASILCKEDGFDKDANLEAIYTSLNFQGNDRLVWLLMAYIQSKVISASADPVVTILENSTLVERFTSLTEDPE